MSPPRWATRAAAVLFTVWALGNVLGEGLAQAGAVGLMLLGLWVAFQSPLPRPVRPFACAALALSLWQALSPAVALARGVAHAWPRSGRYGQWLDTLAPAGAALSAGLGVPWVVLGWVYGAGWVVSTAVGTYQHFVRWPFGQPWWLKTPVERVRESFRVEGPERFAAGGLLFHRLRFAHGAVAALGPALSAAARAAKPWQRACAVGLAGALLAAIYMAYARAALLAAGVMLAAWMLTLLTGRARGAALALGALLVAGVALSPAWRLRLSHAGENVESGERRLAMGVGLRLAREHPLLGVGFGNHKPAALATAAQTGINDFLANDSHDLWVTTWAETGLLGLVLLALYHGTLAWGLWQRLREGSWVAAGALLSWGGFHLLSLVHYLPYHTGVFLGFGLIWGLGLGPGPGHTSRASPPRSAAS